MENARTYLCTLGRLLLSSAFIWAGFGKLMKSERDGAIFCQFACTRYRRMAVWMVIIIEIIGGILILVGLSSPMGRRWRWRYSA